MNSLTKKIKKLFKTLNLKELIKKIYNKVFKKSITKFRCGGKIQDEYLLWMANNEPNNKQLLNQKKYESYLNLKFEIICEYKEELIKSITEQTYAKYKLSKFDYNSIKEIIENSKSNYIVFAQKDIVLAPFALYELVKSIEYKDSILIYSDNDKLINNQRIKPHFKPGFAKDTILSQNYIGGFIAVKKDFLKTNIEILENLNKNYIYDLVLRISEKTLELEHISKILFHELNEDSDINLEDEKQIIEKHLNRRGLEYESIQYGKFRGHYKINYKIKENPKISIIIPNKDHIEDLDKLLKSIEKTTYSNYEIIIVENNSDSIETFEYYDKISKENKKIKILKYHISDFNYSAIVNYGVKNSNGEYVILLNNDVQIITKNWIEEMLMYTQRPDVGVCGVKLYFEDRSIQHAGVTIGTRGLAGHRFRGISEKDFKQEDYINIVQNLSAVTAACFMVKKQLFLNMLGFDEKLAVTFNDVDFCLKIRAQNFLIVYNPFVEAYHYESKSRGHDIGTKKQKRFAQEYKLFVKRWSKEIANGDPYYNKNYRLDTDLPKINYNKIF